MTAVPALRRRVRLAVGGVDVGSALDLVGAVLKWVGLTFLVPAAVALGYGEPPWPFLVGGALAAAAGVGLDRLTGDRSAADVGPREGFLVVALIWLVVPAFGAVPFVLGGAPGLSAPIDAFFEAVSGFTATGATVLADVERLNHSMVFWRQLSHWLGGMGIIVLAVAVLPRMRIGGRHLFERELAGPTEIERMSATIRETARRLWRLYVGMTVLAALVPRHARLDRPRSADDPVPGGLPRLLGRLAGRLRHPERLDRVVRRGHAVDADRLHGPRRAELPAPVGRPRPAPPRGHRPRRGGAPVRGAAAHRHVAARHRAAGGRLRVGRGGRPPGGLPGRGGDDDDRLRDRRLRAVGAAGGDDDRLLMFVGASAGSTGGSIKVIRHLLLFRIVKRELTQTVHRERVAPVTVSGAVVDERALRGAIVFVLLYLLTFVIGALVLSLDAVRAGTDLPAFDAFAAAAACLGNVGPAFGFAGPFGSYEPMSDVSTIALTVLMWLGRLEIVPVAVLLSRGYWRA